MATINGNNQPNVLNGTPQSDFIRGFGGDDTLNGFAGFDELRGGEGNDTANGGLDDDLLRGFHGNDRLNGQAGSDELHGENGADRLDGGAERDRLFGGEGADTLFGRAGDDFLVGSSDTFANDFVGDRLFGGHGNDFFSNGDESSDQLFGENGNDRFFVANDSASGGAGRDFFEISVSGGRVTGGADSDTFFLYTALGDGAQQVAVTDFTTADAFRWAASDRSGLFYESEDVFDFFDSNDDGVVGGRDGSSTSPEGVVFSVTDTGRDLVLFMNEDSVAFRDVSVINDADWA